ncbi:hypothetical protein AB0N79_36780 [Streptomyces microflavus]|uniref:hypothetical protein n=1 Tax=Streptomyces microflavus TaxID=1919 RepID=UPI00343F7F8D
MPLNVPVLLTLTPLDRSYTVHTDRQRWSPGQLASAQDGRAELEAAVREGVRQAAPACAVAGLTEAEMTVSDYPDGSVAMVGRVMCDAAECYASAQRHHFDTAESIEARAAAIWAGEKTMSAAPGELKAVLKDDQSGHRNRARWALELIGGSLLAGVGILLGRWHYERPALASGGELTVWVGEKFAQIANAAAYPLVSVGVVLVVLGIVRGPR